MQTSIYKRALQSFCSYFWYDKRMTMQRHFIKFKYGLFDEIVVLTGEDGWHKGCKHQEQQRKEQTSGVVKNFVAIVTNTEI
jgi:hypothetical protein